MNAGNLIRNTGFKPATAIEDGIARFMGWHKEYYKYQIKEQRAKSKTMEMRPCMGRGPSTYFPLLSLLFSLLIIN